MSGEGFAAKRRAEKDTASVVQSDPPLIDALKEQAPAMTGMAGMFIGTILLAMSIQEFYDRDELRAFGDAGTTKAGFIFMELIFIFIFTAAIIWLARKGLQNFIRWGVLFVLWIAMLYTLVPLSHMIIGENEPPLSSIEEDVDDAYILAVNEDGASFYVFDPSVGEHGAIHHMDDAGGGNGSFAGANVLWTHQITPEDVAPSDLPSLTFSDDGIVMCEGTRWVLLDYDTGNEIDSHSRNCDIGFRYEPTDSNWETCDGADDEPQDWVIEYSRRFTPIPFVMDGEAPPGGTGDCTGEQGDWRRNFPENFDGKNILFSRDVGDDHFLIVSPQWAGMVVYPTGPAPGMNPGDEPIETTWNMSLSGNERFTGVTYGVAPGLDVSSEELTLVLGTNDGDVTGWSVNQSGTVEHQFNMPLDNPIRGLLLADCCAGGSNDLWIVEGDSLRIFMGTSLNEQSRSLEVDGENRVLMALHNVDNGNEPLDDGVLLIEHDGDWSSSTYTVFIPNYAVVIGGIGVQWSEILSLGISIGLMVALLRHPEWYVVNTTGILVGAGVITILGVSFVPILIMLFMVLAAGYDAWAVYKSKHMLELADTMIGLKLPILLVAPQDKEYSFIGEGDSVMHDKGNEIAPMQQHPEKKIRPIKKEGGEAMFMGLGDVIFPGMLCISAMSFLPTVSGPMGWEGSTWVALGTMMGGLVGYFALMTYVARGRPQAGLPLLNGGAILGYVISAAIFVGSIAFEMNVSLF
ncbi:MAG: presenilin family intramembrane aspartyl protease PSH [Candidatus Thalassarchaeaceae archaeon]|jgi:presenilin-like A22 family membrane protease|nr:presenilin family intramembrane aspartyl protease PSH [Candidatus Thalassarchaeaceae archaeon]